MTVGTKEQDQGHGPVQIRQLPTGVPGLDEILGGGLPEYSFNIIAGSPGSGKTTLAHQIVFANATPARPALYFTVLGEPAIKMLRYQQQFSFFDQSKMDGAVRFVNLSQLVLENDLGAVLDAIIKEVEASKAKFVVDSFRTVVRKAQGGASETELQGFVQRLALHLTSWQPVVALPKRRAKLDRTQDADHEVARSGIGSRPAHLPHHERRSAMLPTYVRPHRGLNPCKREEAPTFLWRTRTR